ncbi:MAG TPA: glutamate-5-semialdehyde dehydrogenase, partial [Polyangiaceae bacterium]|nr:glutamate-5-semialdehyde dehydrogenase [Polyangiaceae bacterium]
MSNVRELAVRAKNASRKLATLDRKAKDAALGAVAAALRANKERIFAANKGDLEAARAAGVPAPMLDRLRMDEKVLESTAQGVEYIVSLPDPVGSRSGMQRLQSGVLAGRERVPLGVIAMVYEARPNVTVDAAALCLKSGNAVLLRGGKEAQQTNQVLGAVLHSALESTAVPADAVQIVPAGDREGIREMLSLSDLIDLAIPRGGEGLIRFVAENARVPVIKHYKGVCHMYLDAGCDAEMAARLAVNGNVQRP